MINHSNLILLFDLIKKKNYMDQNIYAPIRSTYQSPYGFAVQSKIAHGTFSIITISIIIEKETLTDDEDTIC